MKSNRATFVRKMTLFKIASFLILVLSLSWMYAQYNELSLENEKIASEKDRLSEQLLEKELEANSLSKEQEEMHDILEEYKIYIEDVQEELQTIQGRVSKSGLE